MGLPFSMYTPRWRGVKFPIHFHCVLHAKRGEGVQIACKIAYVLNGRPLITSLLFEFKVPLPGKLTYDLSRLCMDLYLNRKLILVDQSSFKTNIRNTEEAVRGPQYSPRLFH